MTTRRVRNALLLASLLACLMFVVTALSFADSRARIVRLSDTEGTVQIDRNTGQGFEKAIQNMPITQGVRLETGISGRTEVEFENGTVLHLVENSSVEFVQLSLRSEGQRLSEVRVNDGTVYVNFKKQGGDDFRIDVGNSLLNLDRDAHFRLRMSNNNAEISVFRGELGVEGNGESAKVKKNETFNLNLNDGARYTLAKGITNLETDDWDSERNSYETQYASNYNHSQYPYQYGYSDLNYYGGYFDAPGYGSLWRPYGVGIGWDPFADGAWAFYPGYGYMWISSYPWGWTPYRYGRWVFVSNYGWGWQPGYWNQFNTVPVVINAPNTWRRPLPPPVSGTNGGGTGGGGTVIVGRPPVSRPGRTITSDTITGKPIPGTGVTNVKVAPERPDRPSKDSDALTAPASTAATKSMVPDRSSRTQPMAAPTQQNSSANSVEGQPASKAVVVQSQQNSKAPEAVDRAGREGRSAGNVNQTSPASRSMVPAPTPAPTPHPSPAPAPRSQSPSPSPKSMVAPSHMGGPAMSTASAPHASGGGSRPSSPRH